MMTNIKGYETMNAGDSGIVSQSKSNKLEANNRPYEKPELVFYGDVRDVTLGPTFGGGESGCEGIFRVGPGGCPPP